MLNLYSAFVIYTYKMEINMTRDEQIRQTAISEQKGLMESCVWRDGFVSGAKWADNTMIDKACEILDSMLYMYDGLESDIVTSTHDTVEEFIDQFRKYLEE